MKLFFTQLAVAGISLCFLSAHAQTAAPLKLERTLSLPGVGGKFDHFAYDAAGHRLFIAATGNHAVEVLNLESGKVVESISGLGKPHGLAWVAEEGKLFVADGALAALRIYKGSPLKLVATIPLSDDADDLVYDPATRLLYVGHGGGSASIPGRVAVVDTAKDTLVVNLPASAHPEALEIDPGGKRIFANIADSSEILVIDAATHTVATTWKLTRVKDNVPVAFDAEHRELILGCRTPASAMTVDASTGKELESQPSGAGADDIFYDSATHRAYLVTGSGSVDIYEVSAGGKLKSLGAIKTASGAKTGLLVPEIHTLFVGIPAANGKDAEIRAYSTGS